MPESPEAHLRRRRRDPYNPPFQRFTPAEVDSFRLHVAEFRASLKAKAKIDRGNARLLAADIDALVLMIGTLAKFTNRELMTLCGHTTIHSRGNSAFRIRKVNTRCHEGLMDWGEVDGVLCYWTTTLGTQLVGLETVEEGKVE